MTEAEKLRHSLVRDLTPREFNDLALRIFHYQYQHNEIYRKYTGLLGVRPGNIVNYTQVPFLPIGFFRDHRIWSAPDDRHEKIFLSSGTTGMIPSRHYIRELKLYEESFLAAFRHFYGNPAGYRFLALLPGYLERPDSSLIHMMERMVSLTLDNGSGFFLEDMEGLHAALSIKAGAGKRTLLFGASYALLDFAERYNISHPDLIVMETGGMKGRRKEMVREALHEILCRSFGVDVIHSEYGMTELLSQAYSGGKGLFRCPPWMKVLVRDPNDPLSLVKKGRAGGINVIDLANMHSCAFIATEDLGRLHEDGSFEIVGRFDDSDNRGCNLLVV